MNGKFKELISYIIIIILVLLLKQFIITPIKVNGNSMNPTLYNKDIMILNKISYRFTEIKRFDIVVIHKNDEYLIKRVVGLPLDKVSYKNNQLYINGEVVLENFLKKETEDFDEFMVPDGHYFVLGDNRVDSLDSRIIGPIKKDEIIGKTSIVFFPFSHFGNKK